MKKQILISLILSSVFQLNAQITKMSISDLYEGDTFVGFLGRGNLYTGGWSAFPNILTLTYHARDFAIGGWRKSDGLWNGASLFINSDNGYIGIGTTSPIYRLDVNGTIHAKEVKVDLNGWPDFVFTPTYKLKNLYEVEQYIIANGKLPEIPSAKDVEQNGINIGDMQARLLQKIEELTLYTIEQNKKIIELEKQNRGIVELKQMVKLQSKKIEKLESVLK
jgi:hypothetical protein